jgi:hypothetical protein
LKVRAPKGALPDSLKRELQARKDEVVERLVEDRHRKLCGRLNRTVTTPWGPGCLWQVFHERVGVVLDAQPGRVVFCDPGRIEVP